MPRRPNIVFLFADQWRYHDAGFTGNPDVQTPHLDRLAGDSLRVPSAFSSCPVCCPYRATLMTGQRPLTHGVFLNDIPLETSSPVLAECFRDAGYHTAYIGKWHLNGRMRSAYVPPERRLGFEEWLAFNCTHDYNHSPYFAGEDLEPRVWDGYDAFAQTKSAIEILRREAAEQHPFLLMVSWGPPHNPYHTAPEEYQSLYHGRSLELRPNVPEEKRMEAQKHYAGYYAHISALDTCVGWIVSALEREGLSENTILVVTSDHGDMLHSHGQFGKQRPWEESIRVPLIIRDPRRPESRESSTVLESEDIMPTLLGLAGLPSPESVEGRDLSERLWEDAEDDSEAALLTCPVPFGGFVRERHSGREYRGLRTRRHTYVRDREGPWLLYDNVADPFQMRNLAHVREARDLCREFEAQLKDRLKSSGDEFLRGEDYIEKWGYKTDKDLTIPYVG